MSKELVLKKGELVSYAKKYATKKKLEKYLDYINQLIGFEEELKEYKEGIKEVEKYVKDLINRANNMKLSKEEMEDNFVSFIKGYSVASWKRIIKDLK